jgi:hypothetical protein
MLFEVKKAGSSFLVFEIEAGDSRSGFKAMVNGAILHLTEESSSATGEKNPNLWRLKYDFLTNHVLEIFLISDSGEKLSDKSGMLDLLFKNDPASIHKKIQMRGLPIANGFRYVGSLQGYHWCQSNSHAMSRGDFLSLVSYCLCCSAYRQVQSGCNPSTANCFEVTNRLSQVLLSIDVSDMTNDDARWYPSLAFALAQLCLCQGKYSDCILYLKGMLDNMDAFLTQAPITAYNLSLANCLLSAFLANQKDDQFNYYATNWEKILRRYPSTMEIRLGTMIELKDIYDAWLLNHRIYNQFTSQSYIDHRFKKVTSFEIIEKCMRASPPEFLKKRIASEHLSRFAEAL